MSSSLRANVEVSDLEVGDDDVFEEDSADATHTQRVAEAGAEPSPRPVSAPATNTITRSDSGFIECSIVQKCPQTDMPADHANGTTLPAGDPIIAPTEEAKTPARAPAPAPVGPLSLGFSVPPLPANGQVQGQGSGVEPDVSRVFTMEELRTHDGTGPDGTIYLAINSKVYDVTTGKAFYGAGGAYEHFGGRDASRGLAKFQVKPSDEPLDIGSLSPIQKASLENWEQFYSVKYHQVGVLERRPIVRVATPGPRRNQGRPSLPCSRSCTLV